MTSKGMRVGLVLLLALGATGGAWVWGTSKGHVGGAGSPWPEAPVANAAVAVHHDDDTEDLRSVPTSRVGQRLSYKVSFHLEVHEPNDSAPRTIIVGAAKLDLT
ncbi:MAG TPA: hypothetical protein VIV60_18840, partial [Polyangiaceae bacterium]